MTENKLDRDYLIMIMQRWAAADLAGQNQLKAELQEKARSTNKEEAALAIAALTKINPTGKRLLDQMNSLMNSAYSGSTKKH